MPLLADSLRNLSATLIVSALVIAALVLGRDLFIPLAIAIVIAFVLAPVVQWLTARNVPQPVAAIGTLGLTMAMLIGLSLAFSAQLLSLTADLGTYKQNLLAKVRTVADLGRQDGLIKRAVATIEGIGSDIERELGGGVAPTPQQGNVVVAQQQQGTPKEILTGLSGMLEPAAQAGITILFAILLLLQHHDLRDRIIRIAGTDRMSGTAAAISDAGSKLSDLFLALAIVNAGYGAVIGVALWVIGVPNALLWGVLSMLLRFVPFAGPLLAAVPPIVLAAAFDPGWWTMIAAIALFVVAELIFNNVVETVFLGRKAGLTAFGMVAAASFWTVVWGPIGLLLSAPLTTTLVVFGRHIRGLEFISVLFGDEPALDPAQELYHRLLAGDSAAAASTLTDEGRELSPIELGDRIVLPALKLAAFDHRTSRIDGEQAEKVRETMQDAADLYFDDDTTAKQTADVPVPSKVCVIPARGLIDRAAAEHIALLITQRTPCNAAVATQSAGLTAISDLRAMDDYADVDALVIATVGGVDSQQLRLIARRAARDFPRAHLLVLSLDETSDTNRDEARKDDERIPIQTRVAPIIASLDCAPRRRDEVPTPAQRTAPLVPTA